VVRQVSVEELAARLRAGEKVHLLDVRLPWEHEVARLPGSQLIPLQELPLRLHEVTAEGPIVVYCHHGIRSVSGAALLEQASFADVASLAGGIDAWSLRIDLAVARY